VRNKFTGTVIAITGSTGKTLLKEAINRSLKDKFNIVRSPRSWNSQIGVLYRYGNLTMNTTWQ